jgi:hypothetical protein
MKASGIIILFFALAITVKAQVNIDPKIREVYATYTEEQVSKDPDRLRDLNDILQNRLTVVWSPPASEEKYTKLSSMNLFRVYNPELTRDTVFDIVTFNPLKYDLDFFPRHTMIYRIDDTNYVIMIEPQVKPH